MEVLLPYLILAGTGMAGANLLCLIYRKIGIGIVGNSLTGITGGLIISTLVKMLLPQFAAAFTANPLVTGVAGLLAGALLMLAVGITRRLIED